MNKLIEQHDEKTMRCPRVGGDVNFRFCRSENNLLPCRRIVGCWQMQMDINKFLDEHFSKEELDRAFTPPKPKIESLIELIEQAKKGKKK
ncbi:MAG: hypothetical protein JRJ65_09865 [Deltaproteobacteria bacterium]|nr:hypothetical protein [Deltaproteobacteria bacterium]